MNAPVDSTGIRGRVVETLAGLMACDIPAQFKAEPGYAERNQAWLDGQAKRHREGWPAQRQAMLEAAQRAESMRDTVIGRLTK